VDEATWVLLHGTPLTPAIWRPTAAHLGGRVLVPDCTAVPDGPEPQAALARRVAREVEGDIHLVGHSFGGQVALELALLVPERIRSLTILCSRDTPFPAFAATATEVREGRAPSPVATLNRWFSPAELAAGKTAVKEARVELATASTADWARALDAIAAYDASARTPGLRVAATLVAAGADAVSTPAAMADLEQRLPDARLDVHPEWHHLSPFVDPRALAHLLEAALNPR